MPPSDFLPIWTEFQKETLKLLTWISCVYKKQHRRYSQRKHKEIKQHRCYSLSKPLVLAHEFTSCFASSYSYNTL